MSSSISTKKKNVGMDFLKQTASHLSGAALSYVSEAMPTTTSTLAEAKSTASTVSAALVNTSQSIIPKMRQLRTQVGFRNITTWFMNKAESLDDTGFDESELNFDIDTDSSEIAETQISEISRNANQISKTVVESSQKMVEAQIAATANLTSSMDKQTAVLTAGFDRTNETLNKILEVVTKNTATLIETTVAANSQRSTNDSMVGSGKFNLKDYKKIVSKNFQESQLGMLASIVPAILGDPNAIKDFLSPKNIIGMGFNFALDKKSPNLKKNMAALDKAVNDTIMTSLIRLGESNGWSMQSQIAKMFGLDSSRKDLSASRSSLELKAVPFDTIAHEALTNAVPGYLRKILVALGGPDEIYDYRSRSFKSKGAIHKEFRQVGASSGTLYNADSKVRKSFNNDEFSHMVYDMMMTELGSRTTNGGARNTVKNFANQQAAQEYILNTLLGGMRLNSRELEAAKKFAANLGKATSSDGGIAIANQVARTNVNRNSRVRQYAVNADAYNVDLSDINDNVDADLDHIAEIYGKRRKKSKSTSQIGTSRANQLSGVNYTNVALYEIYRKLNDGINVFQVGKNNSRSDPFEDRKDDYLPKPGFYKAKPARNTGSRRSGPSISNTSSISGEDNEENLLRNNELDDGSMENLSGGQRFVRWGKKRGGNLAKAIFSGSPEQVRDAFTLMMEDIGQVASDGIKKGAAKINANFGNVTGYLKHKMFGSEYSYDDTDENGNKVTKTIAKNEKGGIFGFVKDNIMESFNSAKEKSSNWLKSVLSYFDYGDDSKDPADRKVASKRKKFLASSIGAFAGAGILGGPIGLLVGAMAGNAFSSMGIGDKVKRFFFGHDDKGKPTGLISKAADAIISPIKFQIGKTITFAGGVLKKHVFGPLADIGLALKDRITNHVDSMFKKISDKVLGPIKNFGKWMFGGIAKGVGKAASGLFNLFNTTGPGKAVRGAMGAAGAVIGGLQSGVANSIAGKRSFHTLKKNEEYTIKKGELYLDPQGKMQHASEEMTVNGTMGIKVQTKAYLNSRRASRKAEVDEDLKNSGFYDSGRGVFGKIKGFFGGDYKKWHEADQLKRANRRSKLSEYTSEREKTAQEIAADESKKIAENTEKTAEQTQSLVDDQKALKDIVQGEIIPGSSFKSHDTGVHERLDKIIDITSSISGSEGNMKTGDNTTASGIILPNGISKQEASISSKKSENSDFNKTLLDSSSQIAGEGGYDNKDANSIIEIANGVKNGENKTSIFNKFKSIIGRNKNKDGDDKDKDDEKKEKSVLSEIFGGIGDIILKNWPLILGGLALMSEKFRDLLGEGIKGLMGWLGENLPGILKGAWNLVTDANREMDNLATGSSTVVDPATLEKKSVTSAEQHAEHIENGIFKSALDITMSPFNLGKDALIMAGERSALRLGSSIVQAGAKSISSGASIANIGAKVFQSGSAFVQGVGSAIKGGGSKGIINTLRSGIAKGSSFAGTAWRMGGSTTAQKIAGTAATGAARAGGAKSMFSKVFSPQTLFTPKALANIVGTIAGDISAGVGWETMEIAKNKNFVGDFGMGVNAGGFVRTNTTVKTATTTTIGIAAGIAIANSVAIGTLIVGATNAWNPIGWAALIIGGVLALSAGLAALINWLTGLITDGSDRNYAIRSNSSKLQGVIDGKVSYSNGANNPMYVYCAQESDRVIGLTKGLNVKDPEFMFGKYLRHIADGLASAPGAEILLFDLLNNMAVQGVPFACLVAGDSKECGIKGDQANTNSTGTPPETRTGPLGGGYTQVLKSTVSNNKDVVLSDMAENISRQDGTAVWGEEDLVTVYESGKEVYDALKSEGIISNNGEVKTNKFKGSPGSGKDDAGWKSLDKITRKHDAYFLAKCLLYINSKIEADDKQVQWIENRKDDIVTLMEGLKDFFAKEAEEKRAEMKAKGMTDEEIDKAMSGNTDPKGEQAKEAGNQTKASEISLPSIANSGIRDKDKSDVTKEIKYLTASYAYAHPGILQNWAAANPAESGVNIDNISEISNWKKSFNGDKRKQKTLRSEMATAAASFAESAGDIFNLIPKFDWKEGGKIYTGDKKSPGEKHGSGFVIRGEEKDPDEGTLDKLWDSGEVGVIKTPEDVHKELFGHKDHGKGSESDSTSGQKWFVWQSGVLGHIADKITKYGSPEGLALANGDAGKKWQNVLLNLPANNPPNLSDKNNSSASTVASADTNKVGNSSSKADSFKDEKTGNEISEGGFGGPEDLSGDATVNTHAAVPGLSSSNSTVPSPFIGAGFQYSVPSNVDDCDYGWRNFGGGQFHTGIDIKPTDGDWSIGAVVPGKVTRVNNSITTEKGGSGYGNFVEYESADGTKFLNAHMAPGSIPSGIKAGSEVAPGDKIGKMGTTGNSTGNHLHFETSNPSFTDEKGGHTFDPATILGLSTTSDTGTYSSGSSISTGYNDTYGTVPDESTETAPSIWDILKDAGSKFLSIITGGLIPYSGSSSSSSSSGSSMSNFNGEEGYYYSDTVTPCGNVAEFLALCAKEIGTTEYPPESNNVKYNTWFYGHEVSGRQYPWCMAFVQWCFNQAGMPLKKRTAGCSALLEWWLSNHPDKVDKNPQPGDIVIFSTWSHTGIVESVKGNQITTIEGNTSFSEGGSQSNGGCVARKKRQMSDVKKFIHAVDFNSLASTVSAETAGEATVWKYLKSKGYTDTAAAGIMGCWDKESGNKSDVVEGYYLRSYPGYDRVMSGQTSLDSYTTGTLFPAYDRDGIDYDPSGYIGEDQHYYPGIGLAQWTGDRGHALFKYAREKGLDWRHAGTQFQFFSQEMADKGLNGPINSQGNASAAADFFCRKYEGFNGSKGIAERQQSANRIFNQYKGTGAMTPHSATESAPVQPNLGGLGGGPNSAAKPSRSASNIGRNSYHQPALRLSKQGSKGQRTLSTNSVKPFEIYSANNDDLNYVDNMPYGVTGDNGSMDRVISLMSQMIAELVAINRNTGSSSTLLGSLNEKSFVDQGLRDSIKAAGSSTKRTVARHTQSNPNNVRTVTAMARP